MACTSLFRKKITGDNIMTREEKLSFLHSIQIGAWPTVATMDMGLEFEYVTPEGCGSVLGSFGGWPAHKIFDISTEALNQIKDKIRSSSLRKEALEGTGLKRFYDCVFMPQRSESDIPTLSAFFNGLLGINLSSDAIYALCDPLAWEPEASFYSSYDEMAAAFIDQYEYDIQVWDDLDDEDLDYWINTLEDINGVELVEIHLHEVDDE